MTSQIGEVKVARVHHVLKARKDYPEHGIKKGEPYYWWKPNFGRKHFSKTMPKPSQTTSSEFMSTVLGVEESLAELNLESDFKSEIETAVSDLENLRDETQDKLDNMPEGLQQGDTGQLLQERVDEIDSMINDLEGIDTDIDEELKGDDLEDRKQEILDEIQSISYSGS